MCLLIVAYDKFPSREILQKAEKANSDGAGIAWREGDKVKWAKGLKARELSDFVAYGPPWMIHFRKATVGKAIPELSHPFGVDETADLSVAGETTGGVLAHNGGWWDWHSTLVGLINEGHVLPKGPWSDSRAMAWLAYIKGVDKLKGLSIGDKIAYFSPTTIERFGNWGHEDHINKIAYSYNPSFDRFYSSYYNDDYGGHVYNYQNKTIVTPFEPEVKEFDSVLSYIDDNPDRSRIFKQIQNYRKNTSTRT